MKYLFSFIAILLLNTGLNEKLAAQPQYFNFNTGGTSNSFPFAMPDGRMTQTLHLPGEFSNPAPAPGGQITSVFVQLFAAMTNKTLNEMTIKMGQTTLTDLTAGTFYSGTMTTVYYRSSVVINNPAGWLEFILDTPFPYDPTQSIVIEMGQCSTTFNTGGNITYTITSGIKRVWSAGGCPFTPWSVSNAYTTHTGITLQAGSAPAVVTTAATAVTGTTATLNGTVNANLATTAVSFEYGLTTSYGNTVTGVPATVSGNTVTPVSANITGLVPGTLYHYRAKGSNSIGNTNGSDMTFTALAQLPTVVTTAASGVGATMATLNGTVNAGGASTSVTFEYGLTTAYGTTVSGVPGTVTGNTPTLVSASLTGLTVNTTYHYRVIGVNSVGTSNGLDLTFFTSNCPLPNAPGTISGPTSGCGNTSGNVYSVLPISNATGYTWAVPPGVVITSGTGTNSITVTFGNTSGTVSVFGINTCGNGPTASLPVTVNALPSPTITGLNSVCASSGNNTYTTETGMTGYVWTVSAGGTITGGQGTSSVQVSWTTAGAQTVSVNYTNANGCSALTPMVFNVTVNGTPGAAGTITGTSAVCGGAMGVAYSCSTIPGASFYAWNLPTGATIATGSGTNNITVDFAASATSGDISVYGNNLCGNGTPSPNFPVTVNALPAAAGTVTGDADVCVNSTAHVYTVPLITGATSYTWIIPTGAVITSGANSNMITVTFGPTVGPGTISVSGTNSCGSGATSPNFAVTVHAIPAAPVVTVSGNVLTSSAPAGNQWYYEGTAIAGATGQTYTVSNNTGYYTCMVTLYGCSSPVSNQVWVVVTGQQELKSGNFNIFPVPNDGRFTVTITAPAPDAYSIRVFNSVGVMTHEYTGIWVNGTREKAIDLRPVPDGVYTLVILNSRSQTVRKIIVSK